jgi:hypothetical protein
MDRHRGAGLRELGADHPEVAGAHGAAEFARDSLDAVALGLSAGARVVVGAAATGSGRVDPCSTQADRARVARAAAVIVLKCFMGFVSIGYRGDFESAAPAFAWVAWGPGIGGLTSPSPDRERHLVLRHER